MSPSQSQGGSRSGKPGEQTDLPLGSGRRRRDSERELDVKRLLNLTCVKGCGRAARDDSDKCDACYAKAKSASARSVRRLRERRRKRGECVYCGRTSKTVRCVACRLKQGRLGVVAKVVNREAIHSADYDGRVRYRGQGKRGAPPKEVNDRLDFDMATKSFERARDGFVRADQSGTPPDDAEALRLAAIGQLALARKLIEEIEQRNAKFRSGAARAKRERRAKQR